MKYFLFLFKGNEGIFFPEPTSMMGVSRESILANYVAYNNVPMGTTHFKGRLFVTVPRRRPGIPSTLNYILTKSTRGSSPSFRAYPDFATNELHVNEGFIFLAPNVPCFFIRSRAIFIRSQRWAQIHRESFQFTGRESMNAIVCGSSIQAFWNIRVNIQYSLICSSNKWFFIVQIMQRKYSLHQFGLSI